MAEVSNHIPILLNTVGSKIFRGKRHFRFLEVWTTENSSLEVVKNAWEQHARGGMEPHKVQRRLNCTARALRIWNRSVFGFTHDRIGSLEKDLERICFDSTRKEEQQLWLEEKLKCQHSRHESIMQQKSRELWLVKGDGNTKFFHASVTNKCRRNKIHAIFDGVRWLNNPPEITKYFLDNFHDVYTLDSLNIPEDFGDLGFECLSREENDDLMKIPSEGKIKESIQSLHPLKAPEPDGFSGIFFCHYWETVRLQVVKVVQESFRK